MRKNPKAERVDAGFFCQSRELLKRIKDYKIWQVQRNLWEHFLEHKLEYVRNIAVQEMVVAKPEDNLFSSAKNYPELDCLLDVYLISKRWKYIEVEFERVTNARQLVNPSKDGSPNTCFVGFPFGYVSQNSSPFFIRKLFILQSQ